MTNKDKFLKDGVSVEEFAFKIGLLIADGYRAGKNEKEYWPVNEVEKWLEEQAKPTLTEDERVILRNLKIRGINAEYIERTRNTGYLRVGSRSGAAGVDVANIDMYSHMFQFIKEGEEYSIEELLKDDN